MEPQITELVSNPPAGEIPNDSRGINAIAAYAAQAAGHRTTPRQHGDLLVYPPEPGHDPQVVNLAAHRRADAEQARRSVHRKAGTYTVSDVDSFTRYYAKHAEESAEVWVNEQGARAVLNAYSHAPGEDGYNDEDHVLLLKLRLSPEWQAWMKVNGKLQGHADFAEWLTSVRTDIYQPDSATVLEAVQSLQVTANSKSEFKNSKRNGTDGARSFLFEETSTAKAGQKGELEVPEKFSVRLRVFAGDEMIYLDARLRYKISDGDLLLGIVIDRPELLIERAVEAIHSQISAGIDRGAVFAS